MRDGMAGAGEVLEVEVLEIEEVGETRGLEKLEVEDIVGAVTDWEGWVVKVVIDVGKVWLLEDAADEIKALGRH
jgi:hypothetical protein